MSRDFVPISINWLPDEKLPRNAITPLPSELFLEVASGCHKALSRIGRLRELLQSVKVTPQMAEGARLERCIHFDFVVRLRDPNAPVPHAEEDWLKATGRVSQVKSEWGTALTFSDHFANVMERALFVVAENALRECQLEASRWETLIRP